MRSNSNIQILVLGGHIQGLGIVRIFAQQGFRIAVLDETNLNLARFSRHCSEFIKCKNEEVEDFLYHLKSVPKFDKCVIFPTNDFYVELLAKIKNKITPQLICAVDSWEKINIFYSKEKAYQLANALSIDIAKTIQIQSLEDVSTLKIQYPCIIKPTVMHTFYKKFKKKVIICNNPNELRKQLDLVISFFSVDELLIQEIIPGDNSCQFSIGVFAIEGKIIRSITANRARQHPIDFGNATTMAITCDKPEIVEYAQKILNATKYTGVCEIEFKQDAISGKYIFLEVNSRTWKWHSICQAAKVDLLLPYYDFLNTGKFQFETQFQENAYFIHGLTDIPTKIKMRLKNLNVVKSPNNYKRQAAVWDSRDNLPWFMEKLFIPYFLFKR